MHQPLNRPASAGAVVQAADAEHGEAPHTQHGSRSRPVTVLVTDGDQRAALAIVRSLGAGGYRCVVTSPDGRSLAGASRHAVADIAVPEPGTAPETYVTKVRAIIEEENAALLLPVTEASLLALLPVRGRLGAVVPFPDAETFRTICDKRRVLETAATMGLRVPAQREIRSIEDREQLSWSGPVILKPGRSVYTRSDGTREKTGVRWARSREEFESALSAYVPEAYPILVQEVIEGPGTGIFVLLDEGRVLARFAHRRIREKPPTGGVSVVRQSEPMDEELLDRSVDLLNRLGWSGVAMVEYKRDLETGEAVLMEINGRFWGSLQLAIDAGVDFPRLLADVSLRRPVIPSDGYRFVRSRWFWGDVDHLLAVWRRGGPRQGSRMGSLAAWLRAFGPGYRSEVFRPDDPMPFARETANWFREGLSR